MASVYDKSAERAYRLPSGKTIVFDASQYFVKDIVALSSCDTLPPLPADFFRAKGG